MATSTAVAEKASTGGAGDYAVSEGTGNRTATLVMPKAGTYRVIMAPSDGATVP